MAYAGPSNRGQSQEKLTPTEWDSTIPVLESLVSVRDAMNVLPRMAAPDLTSFIQPSLLGRLAGLGRRVDAGVCVLLALPWLVLAADPLWIYSSLYRDPWSYFGHLQDLPGHLKAFGDHYQTGRLSALIPGWLVYSVFPPIAANLILHIGVAKAALLSGYVALARTVGRRAALLAMIAMGGHFFFFKAVGWDYVDGYVITYFLMTAALITQAVRPGRWWRVWVAAAGSTGAGLMSAYLGYAPLLVPLAGLFIVLNRSGARHSLESAGFWTGVGFFGTLIGLGIFSKALGGPFLFLLPSVIYATRTFGPEAAAQYIFPPEVWIDRAGWLVLPAAAAIGAVVGLLRSGRLWLRGEATRADAASSYFQTQLLALVVVLAIKQVRGELGFLQVWLAASGTVMVAAFLALGGQLGRWANGFPPGQYRMVAAIWTALILAGTLTAERLHIPGWGAAVPLAAALAGAVLAVMAIQVFPSRVAVGLGAAALFGLVSVSTRAHFQMGDSLGRAGDEIRIDRCQAFEPNRKACFQVIAETARWTKELAPAGQVWFWYNLDDPLGPVYDMAAHTNGHYLQLVNVRFPDLPDGKVYRGDPVQIIARKGGAVVVLSPDPEAAAKALYWIRGCGMTAEVESTRTIGRHPPIILLATVIRVAGPKPPNPRQTALRL